MLRSVTDPSFSFGYLLDGFDLRTLHFISCILGATLSVYVNQLWQRGALLFSEDCLISRYARRISLASLGLTMLWAASYSHSKGWQPWPPDVAIVLAVDGLLFSSVVVAFRRQRLLG